MYSQCIHSILIAAVEEAKEAREEERGITAREEAAEARAAQEKDQDLINQISMLEIITVPPI